MLIFFPKRT